MTLFGPEPMRESLRYPRSDRCACLRFTSWRKACRLQIGNPGGVFVARSLRWPIVRWSGVIQINQS